MLLVGAVFVYGALTIDPASNCNESGECAPWLVPLAGLVGALFGAMGLANLLSNPGRGSHFDADAGRLEWWQNRYSGTAGDGGSIALNQIGRIRIKRDSEGDEISLYDSADERLHFFDSDVIRENPGKWAEKVRELVPEIPLQIVD